MKTRIILVAVLLLLLGQEFGAQAEQAADSQVMRIKALQVELLSTRDAERQISIKRELAEMLSRDTDRVPHGRLDQGGESWFDATTLPPDPSISASGTTMGYASDFNVADLEFPPNPCWQGYFDQFLTCSGPDVTYLYTAPLSGLYHISICNSDYDTGLLVYTPNPGPPENPTDLICGNDDFCGVTGFQSEIPALPLVAGQQILIVVDGWNGGAGNYLLEITFTEGGGPANDNCSGAQFVEPFSPVTGNTTEATNDIVPDCGTSISAPGVWYVTTGTGNTMTAHTCFGASYDTKINVYTGDCTAPICVTGNDDACGLQSSATWCSVAGQVYFILVQGFSGQTGSFTFVVEDNGIPCTGGSQVYSIPELYSVLPDLVGTSVRIECYMTDESQNLLVDNLMVWQTNQIFPPNFALHIASGIISPSYWNQLIIVEGIVDVNPSMPPGDNAVIFLAAAPPVVIPMPPSPVLPANWRPANWPPSAECDTCRFAILLSGGVDSTNNRSDYWDDLVDFYCYKRSHNWCEANTKVYYFKGNRPTAPFNTRGNAVPAAAVDSATQAKIQTQINAISSKIKACKAAGKTSSFEMVVSNHGQQRVNNANPGGINMLGNDLITPTELTAMMQTLVDSGLTKMDLELGQCFSGQLVDSLRANLVARGCDVTAASSTDDAHSSFSKGGNGGYNAWLNPKVCALQNGKSLQEAILEANKAYDAYIEAWIAYATAVIPALRSHGTHADSVAAQSWQDWLDGATGSPNKSQYWRTFSLKKRCQADTIVVKPGGRLEITYSGPTSSCGNSEVMCRDTLGKWVRVAHWNWNVPGSAGYVNGQNVRRVDAGPGHSGVYVLHSLSDSFNVSVKAVNPPLPAILETSPSNPQDYAGFGVGWQSGSSEEFGSHAGGVLSSRQCR